MAFTINKIKSGQSPEQIAEMFRNRFSGTRFTMRIETHRSKVTIHDIRLTYSKEYCGNHPLPCPNRGFVQKHKKAKYLEGGDWVAFNDFLNDCLDAMGCICNAKSSLCIIRKHGERCTAYDSRPQGDFNNEWVKDSGVFENKINSGTPVQAHYPEGTPGFHTAFGQPNYTEHHH